MRGMNSSPVPDADFPGLFMPDTDVDKGESRGYIQST